MSHRSGSGTLKLLDDVSLFIAPRHFVALIGPSGSGKSTLMNALSARAPADEGFVELNGIDLYTNFESLKQGMALVPQDEALHMPLRLDEAVGYTARLRLPPDTDKTDIEETVVQSLARVNLTDQSATAIKNLSGGQRKRACLANETVHDPSLLFVDEVTSGLDEQTDREIMRLMREHADRGRTVVCVTHTLANVAEFCHEIVVMKSGVLAFYGTPEECLNYFGVDQLGLVYPGSPSTRAPIGKRATAKARCMRSTSRKAPSPHCRRGMIPRRARSRADSPSTCARYDGSSRS